MKLHMQGTKGKKLYIGNELLGIERRGSPILTKEKRASHMKNLLCVDGINRKRNGWREIYHFRDGRDKDLKINGIYEYKGKEIFHAGEYLLNGGIKVGTLADKKSCGFENNGLLYIVCAGELFIYDGNMLKNAYDSVYSYIPLTTKNISPIGTESIAKEEQSPSLITPKRRNTLIGDKSERKKYRLDGKLDINKPIEIKTKTIIKLDSQEENEAPYNGIYKEATRLYESNIEGVIGTDEDTIYDIFNGSGTDTDFSEVEEVWVFFKMPVKIDSAIFEAREGYKLPRASFHFGTEAVYDTEATIKTEKYDFTDTLYGQSIDGICFYGNGGEAIINKVNIQCRECYEGEIEITHRISNITYNEYIRSTSIKDTGGRELTLSKNRKGSQNQNTSVWFEKGAGDGEAIIGFNFCNASPTPNESNIEITYYVTDGEKILCDIGEVCKTDTGSAILALASGNTAYLSCGEHGFGYFPASLKRTIGTDEKITALCGMSDSTLGVFKQGSVYYFKPECKDNKTELKLTGYSGQGGSLSHFATKTVNLDTLSPQKDNIYGSQGADLRVRRGSNIAFDLDKLSLDSSVALSYKGAYYLFADGKVYVADSRYKSYENNRLDSSYEYEWWYLENIPATYVAEINGLMYIGREDGRIVIPYNDYNDIYYENIDTGSFILSENEAGDTVLYLNEELELCAYDKILVSNSYRYLCDIVRTEASDGKIKLILRNTDFWSEVSPVRIYPDTELYLQKSNGELVKSTVEKIDAYECSLTLDLSENSDTYTGILIKNNREEYTLDVEGDHFLLLDRYGLRAKLCFYEDAILICERRKPVEIEYVSSAILNNSHTDKTLYGISVELLGDSEGVCELSYETNSSFVKKSYELGSFFNFNDLDFSSVTFNSSLQKGYSMRCFERNLEYIIIKIKHSEAKPIALKGYLLTYTENN